MNTNFNLKMSLPKVPDIELLAIDGLERMGRFLGITDEKIGEARIVVNEAIINALEHSGKEDSNVNVEFMITKEKLTILVADTGKGFNPDVVKTPEIAEKIKSKNKRGWGIKLMKSLSDDLKIKSGPSGTEITIIKNLI